MRHSTRSLLLMIAAGSWLTLAPTPAGAVSSGFDTDLEGWTSVGIDPDVGVSFPGPRGS